MDFKIIIGLAKWFLIRQIEKYTDDIDWAKVAQDFVDRVAKMIPKSVFGDVEQLNTRKFMVSFGKNYDARGIASMYGQQGFATAFEACFGDTDAAKLSECQDAFLASLKPPEKKPEKVAEKKEDKKPDKKPEEKTAVAAAEENQDPKKGFFGGKKDGKKSGKPA